MLKFLKGIRDKIAKAFRGVGPESAIGKLGQKIAQKYDQVLELYIEGIHKATENMAYKNTTGEDGVMYDLREDINGNTFVEVDPSIYDSTNGENIAQVIAQIISNRFHNLIQANGQTIRINATTNSEWRRSEDATKLMKKSPSIYDDKMKAIGNADELLMAAQNWIGEEKQHNTDNKIVEYARGDVLYRVGDKGYIADILVGTKEDGSAVLYDLVDIHEIEIVEAPVSKAMDSRLSIQRTSTEDRITHSSQNVKNQSRDTDYLSAVERGDMETAQRMVDEAANAAGYTIKAYHGTGENFTVFDLIAQARYKGDERAQLCTIVRR